MESEFYLMELFSGLGMELQSEKKSGHRINIL